MKDLVCYSCGTETEFAFSQNSGHCICCGGGIIATYEEYIEKNEKLKDHIGLSCRKGVTNE
ncbi:hypothetical protein [Parageobacillus thermoglucosidasius]|uniref:hypothetical protein n=1 Tax=Parageobacillus thermoglucosidasius TaxID=1426 RepID=UPI002E20B10F|nr:hypothetical protein [Parageobacillus thermoglucosidasius]MED4946526.1 hypothetical protein [Parageobacillus thermoglucosidasius]MED4984087.1 hypothetical protein [Parageobacillus thermoglucosidasius]